jgi:hypothetical protein
MQIPEDTQNSHRFPGKKAVRLLTATSQWDYTPMHKDTVGGALALSYDVNTGAPETRSDKREAVHFCHPGEDSKRAKK